MGRRASASYRCGVAPEIDEDVLDDVLGPDVISQDLQRGRMDGRRELVEHLGERAVVPGRQAGGEEGAGGLHGRDRTAVGPATEPGAWTAPAADGALARAVPARLLYVAGRRDRITRFSVIRRCPPRRTWRSRRGTRPHRGSSTWPSSPRSRCAGSPGSSTTPSGRASGWLERTPEGGLAHLAWWEGEDNHNLDAWESEAAFDAFGRDRLAPAMAAVGTRPRPRR